MSDVDDRELPSDLLRRGVSGTLLVDALTDSFQHANPQPWAGCLDELSSDELQQVLTLLEGRRVESSLRSLCFPLDESVYSAMETSIRQELSAR
jgi:hypothetical protein